MPPVGRVFTTNLNSFDRFVGFVTKKMKILLLVIGKTDEDYLITGIKKYVGRIGHYASFEMKEIPDPRNRKTLSEDQQKKAESFLLLQQIQPGDQVILLDENGHHWIVINQAGNPDSQEDIGEKMPFAELVCFFELACALSGYMEGVNPFDQPGVEAYKKLMFAGLAEWK